MTPRTILTQAHELSALRGDQPAADFYDAALRRLDTFEQHEPIRMPIDSWLSGGAGRVVAGAYIDGRATVLLTEDRFLVARGHGATLTEAFAAALNDAFARMHAEEGT